VPRLLGVHLVHLRVAHRRSPHKQHGDAGTSERWGRGEDSCGDVGTIRASSLQLYVLEAGLGRVPMSSVI
jgi:hypothetical protein